MTSLLSQRIKSHSTHGRQVAQSVERRTLEVDIGGSKPTLGTWWWCRIPPNQPYSKGAAPAASTLLTEWSPEFPAKKKNYERKCFSWGFLIDVPVVAVVLLDNAYKISNFIEQVFTIIEINCRPFVDY